MRSKVGEHCVKDTKEEEEQSICRPIAANSGYDLVDNCHLKGHCIEFKYYADGIHSGLTPPG